MLEIKNCTKYYGEHCALENLSFEVNRGEIFGIVGENGSGKTTTFRLILQLLEPNSGEIIFNNEQIKNIDRQKIGYLPEERSLYRELSVERQLKFFANLKGVDESKVNVAIDWWLERMEIKDFKCKRIRELSKGNQQKIQLIGSLIHDPEVLILDEPFSGLDPYNLILFKSVFEEQRQKGKFILLSTHRLDHIETFCNKIVLLKKGKTILQGNIAAIRKESDKRFIKVLGDIPYHQIRDLKYVENFKRDGKMIRLEITSEKNAMKVMNKIIDNYEVISIQYELPTLQDIFLEINNYE